MKKPLLSKLRKLLEIDRNISFDSQNPALYHKRGLALQDLGCNSLAIQDYKICAFLEKNDDLNIYNNLVYEDKKSIFPYLFNSEENTIYYSLIYSIIKHDHCLFESTIDPVHFLERGKMLERLGLINLALKDYNEAQKHLKNFYNEYTVTCFNKALFLLRCNYFDEGWRLYEYRWSLNVPPFNYHPFTVPKWNGEVLTGQKLLVHYEQGIGDCIHFIRYALKLKEMGINVIALVHPKTEKLLEYTLEKHGIHLLHKNKEMMFDKYIPLMSIPNVMHFEPHNIPYKNKYIFIEQKYLDVWFNKLDGRNRTKIGVFWESNSDFTENHIRNIPFEQMKDLFSLNMEFHCLQNVISEKDKSLCRAFNNLFLWDNEINDLNDTAAIIHQLDLVITIDTSIAHLSAALGIPTWILIPYHADCRWLMDGSSSIWYESVKLFRQDLDYDWKNVIERVYIELSNKF